MACPLLINVFVCAGIKAFRLLFGVLLPFEGGALTAATLVLTSIITYLMAKMFGRIGGIVLAVIGIVGALVTGGTTLILTLLGAVLIFWGKAARALVVVNVLLFALCYFMGCL